MTVSIGYRPYNPKSLKYVDGGSSLCRVLSDEYGYSFTLEDSDIQFLKGVCACGHKGAQELIDAIVEFGKIEVKAGY